MLTTDQKGAAAELAIAYLAAELGVGVFKPLTDGERYDLIFHFRPRLVRVQCKWASRLDEVLVIRCRRCRRTSAGLLHRSYTADEIDAIAAYSGELRRAFFLPVAFSPGDPQCSFGCPRVETISGQASTGRTTSISALD
jgi:hypothetical protein